MRRLQQHWAEADSREVAKIILFVARFAVRTCFVVVFF